MKRIETINIIDKHKLMSSQKFSTYQVDRIIKDIYPELKGEPHKLLISNMVPAYDSENEKPSWDEIYANEYCTVRYMHEQNTYSETINWSGVLNLIQYFDSKYTTQYNDLVKIAHYFRNNYLSVIQAEKLLSEITGNDGLSKIWFTDLIARPIYWKLEKLKILPFKFCDLDDELVKKIESDYVRIDLNIPFRFELTWPGFFMIMKDLYLQDL